MHHDFRGAAGRLKGIVLIHPWFWGKEPIGEEPRPGLSRIFLAGDSAGGNICHHLTMHHDFRGAAGRLKGIVLIHPWFWGKEPIGEEPRPGRAEGVEQKGLWEFVCPDAVDGADDPRMDPTAQICFRDEYNYASQKGKRERKQAGYISPVARQSSVSPSANL
ncbi:putative carboxylesterase 2 [Triticum urartu]|uniref:Putative carboxylesterase 2 n=1 Tax=Triticum urartu TaxID=4572 RepID=M7ZPP0_TRIUA|nr:putative carboxylesterase 2 [Triticum urartu]